MNQDLNHKQAPEASGTPKDISPDYAELEEVPVGTSIFIEEHVCQIDGIAFPDGGHYALLLGVVESKGSKFVRVYYNGERTYPIQYAKSEFRRAKTTVVSTPQNSSNGKVIIECAGLEGKPCSVKREILLSDTHHVKRCRDCQKEHNKLMTKQRMKELRAKRRANEAAQKEAARRISRDVNRQEGKN